MTYGATLLLQAREDGTAFVLAALLVIAGLSRIAGFSERLRVRATFFFGFLHLGLLPVVALLRTDGTSLYVDLRLASLAFAAVTGMSATGTLLFALILPRAGVKAPRILQDVAVAGAGVIAVFVVASRNGLNVSGLVATSAVLTGVVGFALQDTLGNIASGLALQLDNSISIGDWIRVGDVTGQVKDIRWRHTSVETRNWETVLIPNNLLTKSEVAILGRRAEKPLQLRRWVWFTVDYRFPPSDVIRTVTDALRSAELPNVAELPQPGCVLMDFADSSARYAVRYWLTDLAVDDPTDSRVRTWIYFALKRAGIPISIPSHSIFMTEESQGRKAELEQADFVARLAAISKVELFLHLSEEERRLLAHNLRAAPFAEGEVMTRQGAEAHWLYIVVHGRASVRVAAGSGGSREVGQINDGEFFGEMSLMTGAPRTATVVALTDVECYRLDKTAFQGIVHARPELAEYIATVLAKRRTELATVIGDLDTEAEAQRMAKDKNDLVHKIRRFFGLGPAEPAAGNRSL